MRGRMHILGLSKTYLFGQRIAEGESGMWEGLKGRAVWAGLHKD